MPKTKNNSSMKTKRVPGEKGSPHPTKTIKKQTPKYFFMGNGRTKKNNSGETHAEALNRLGIVELTDPWGQKQFRTANKEAHVAPKIERTYFDEDNVRMYECEGGRLFVADTYDERFTPTHGKRMFKAK